jgi:hypothetical protein
MKFLEDAPQEAQSKRLECEPKELPLEAFRVEGF